jgi:hypothetical protein
MNQQSAQSLLKDTSSISSIGNRLRAPSPTLFKNITKIMVALSGLGISLLGVPATLQALGVDFHLPKLLTELSSYMIVAGVIGSFISKLTINKEAVQDIANQPPQP